MELAEAWPLSLLRALVRGLAEFRAPVWTAELGAPAELRAPDVAGVAARCARAEAAEFPWEVESVAAWAELRAPVWTAELVAWAELRAPDVAAAAAWGARAEAAESPWVVEWVAARAELRAPVWTGELAAWAELRAPEVAAVAAPVLASLPPDAAAELESLELEAPARAMGALRWGLVLA